MTATPPHSRMLDPEAADLSLMQDRQVAVVGFDVDVSAHALNLRDSGIEVKVGIDPESRAAARAEMEGLQVLPIEEAVGRSDVVVLSRVDLPDELLAQLHQGLEPGDLVVRTGAGSGAEFPPGVDVVMVSAVGGSDRLRKEYEDGRGSPVLVGVHTDATGMAWHLVAAYSAALGSLRAGALAVDPSHLKQATAFAVTGLHDTVQQLTEEVFDILTGAGVPAEVAYLVSVHELQERIARVAKDGWSSQYGPAGTTEGGGVLDDQLRHRLSQLWSQVTEQAQPEVRPAPAASRRDAAASAHPIEQVGKDVRALMSWVR